MTNRKIIIEQCCCGHRACRDYWLVGIGKFVQGSGFTQEEAQRIADLLNRDDRDRRRATRHDHVSHDGREAFFSGWGTQACPHHPMTVEAMRWNAAWWAANADAFESHINMHEDVT